MKTDKPKMAAPPPKIEDEKPIVPDEGKRRKKMTGRESTVVTRGFLSTPIIGKNDLVGA